MPFSKSRSREIPLVSEGHEKEYFISILGPEVGLLLCPRLYTVLHRSRETEFWNERRCSPLKP
jgi:hypothetical protein